jgi:hypothetical protein
MWEENSIARIENKTLRRMIWKEDNSRNGILVDKGKQTKQK